MRRAVSTILFVLGGWMLSGEVLVAFFDVEAGLSDNAMMIALLMIFAAVPLLLGAWASPGQRWRELGLTILIAAAIALFCGLTALVMFMDPAFARYMPPLPEIRVAPVVGAVNLLVISAVGWLLYQRPVSGGDAT
jgi:hypothetical protein